MFLHGHKIFLQYDPTIVSFRFKTFNFFVPPLFEYILLYTMILKIYLT